MRTRVRCGLLFLTFLFAGSAWAANNPVPQLDQPIAPMSAVPGGPGFTLTVRGAGFVSGSVVNWNGSPRPTTFVDAGKITAAIPASDIISAGTATIMTTNPLRRVDFFETRTGNCRLRSQICTKLSGTAFTWGKLVAPWAENVARTLWTGAKSGRSGNSALPTRLTQQRRTEAKGKVWISTVEHPKTDHLCCGCGKEISNESTHCADCAVEKATKRLISVASVGRITARSPEARAKHGATRRKHAKARSEWDASMQPAWITDDLYTEEIQPQLSQMSTSAIASRIGVSRLVRRPHSAGLPSAPKAFADARPNGWLGFQARLSPGVPDDLPVKTGCEFPWACGPAMEMKAALPRPIDSKWVKARLSTEFVMGLRPTYRDEKRTAEAR